MQAIQIASVGQIQIPLDGNPGGLAYFADFYVIRWQIAIPENDCFVIRPYFY
jgi:hypothetical protein